MELNKIYCESNLETLARMPDEFLDLAVTSPPYDDLRTYNGYSWDFEMLADALYRKTKQGGVVVWVVGDATVNGSESLSSCRHKIGFHDAGFLVHDTMIYEKVNYAPLTHNRYEQAFEFMFAFSKGRPKTFNPIRVKCENAGKVEKYGLTRRQNHGVNHAMRLYAETTFIATGETKIAGNIFSYTVGGEKTGHPAPFPTNLAKDQISSWSNPGDLVYDCFMGSGTTAKAAHLLGRNWIGSEISAEYVELANKRLEPYLAQANLFEVTA